MTPVRSAGLLAVLAALLALPACNRAPDTQVAEAISAQPTMQPDDVVDLTVYFRSGEGSSAHLVGVTKEVAITDDLPRQAVQLLIDGPAETDGAGLSPALPPETRVLDLTVTDGTAHLDLSHEVISEADEVNPSPEHEALALAAIAGTLTEFPAIERVRLSVEGRQTGWRSGVDVSAFWGAWGLPELLVRDESVMSDPAAEGDGVPDLALFSTDEQTVGAPPSEPVAVTNVRVRDRATYLRIIVELAAVSDDGTPASVPPARARLDGDRIVLEIDDVAAYEADFEPGQRVELDDPAFQGVAVEDTDEEDTVRIAVLPGGERDFWLQDLSSPTRIVLDVRK